MKLLSFKNKIHQSVNTIFYIIILGIGFIIGLVFNKIDYNKLLSQVLMIDSVSAYTITTTSAGEVINEDFIINKFSSSISDFNADDYEYAYYKWSGQNYWTVYAIVKENIHLATQDSSNGTLGYGSVNCNIETGKPCYYLFNIRTSGSQTVSYASSGGATIQYSNFDSLSQYNSSFTYDYSSKNKLDFSKYLTPPIELDPQVNTWNGYGYDFYTNQVGILDMRKDTYIVNSHTCPNDGEFVTGYDGQTKDICSWSYYSDLSDFLVFYFNGRIYDSENVEWSNITFLKDHTYSLSFTLYGLVPQEQLYSIQFSLEGELTQEIYSSNFGKVLTDSLDSRTYLTFSITPTEDITFDHFFLKYFTNGSYAQTVGASRLWVYNDYTGLSEDAMQIIQTDKLLSQNQSLKDLIENPFVNKDNVDSFWNNFKQDDFGLTQIVTLPLTTIKKISNGTCTPLNINILGKTIQLPCGDTLFWNREDIKDFKVFWNMIFGGILCYGIAISIYKDIHKAQSPMNDKLEVIDL